MEGIYIQISLSLKVRVMFNLVKRLQFEETLIFISINRDNPTPKV